MSRSRTLAEGGRFANRLFRYAYVKLYALRHGLTAAVPAWEGEQLFGLADKPCTDLPFPRLTFNGFTDEDRRLWERDDPPIDVDLSGYFQELPECWRRHRQLLRRLFQLPAGILQAMDAWHQEVTDGGRRTLVAIHVRRGDYRGLQLQSSPWFRLVPTEWYLAWLRAVWPTLRDPVLYVATDEPEAIRPLFREFEIVSAPSGSIAPALPDHVRDFEILRRADYLAACNSSFSRMAAILAPATQSCFLPSFQRQDFEPYEPWLDQAFWARFKDSWHDGRQRGARRERPTSSSSNALDAAAGTTLLFDVSDLLLYLLDHSTVSGIQRVHCEILRNLLDIACPLPIRLVVADRGGGLCAIESSALLDVIEEIRSGDGCRDDIVSELRALLGRAVPVTARPRDIFLVIGAFWTVKGMGLLLQRLKNAQVISGILIHDIIPLVAPEYFEAHDTRVFAKGVSEALSFADFVLTTSEYNKASLIQHMTARKSDPLPVHLLPLGSEPLRAAPLQSGISSVVADIIASDYVLCVGTLEVRKNPTYLFNIWKMMVRSGRSNIPNLVFAGRKGWLVQDFMDQLTACGFLGGRIVVVHSATDVELDCAVSEMRAHDVSEFRRRLGAAGRGKPRPRKDLPMLRHGGHTGRGRGPRGLYRPLQRRRWPRAAVAVSGRPRAAPQSRARDRGEFRTSLLARSRGRLAPVDPSAGAPGGAIRRRCGNQIAGGAVSANRPQPCGDSGGGERWGAVHRADLHFRLEITRKFGRACGRADHDGQVSCRRAGGSPAKSGLSAGGPRWRCSDPGLLWFRGAS